MVSKSTINNQQSTISNPQSLIPNPFVVRTPTATVTDLGTEFGVEVTNDQHSHLHVFQGKIAVRTGVDSFGASREIEMNAGESALVDGQGAVTRYSGTQVHATGNLIGFVRTLPKKVIKVLNLVNVVAGGDGFGRASGRGIDPRTGEIAIAQLSDPKPKDWLSRFGFEGDGRYHRVGKLPFVDGVFIPDSRERPVQLDSAGHTFAEFPKTDNRSWSYIWAGPLPEVDWRRCIPTALWGIDYASLPHSVLIDACQQGNHFRFGRHSSSKSPMEDTGVLCRGWQHISTHNE